MNDRNGYLSQLRDLKRKHEAAIGEGPGRAPGFAEDEAATRKSYLLTVTDALQSGAVSRTDLERAGLPEALDTNDI